MIIDYYNNKNNNFYNYNMIEICFYQLIKKIVNRYIIQNRESNNLKLINFKIIEIYLMNNIKKKSF